MSKASNCLVLAASMYITLTSRKLLRILLKNETKSLIELLGFFLKNILMHHLLSYSILHMIATKVPYIPHMPT
jgi:hypothetical protein